MLSPTALDRNGLHFSWLIKLRWSSVLGQVATFLTVRWLFDIDVPLAPLLVIVGIEFASNVACALWFKRATQVEEWHLAAVMAVDVLFLTALLYFTGGPFNPFCFLYLVNIALAAVVLHAQWTWALVALSLASFALLFLDFRELSIQHLEPGDQIGILQQGMWVAFGVTAVFIVHFVWRVTRALAAREQELGQAKRQAERQDHLASLATMTAGAAHELSTPLGTIALVAKELERSLEKNGGSEDALEDLRLIRQQVARCRLILDQMGGGVGRSGDLTLEDVRVADLVEEATTGVRAAPAVSVEVESRAAEAVLRLPQQAVAQALRSLVTNAQDASQSDSPVQVRAKAVDGSIMVSVDDHGRGMSPDVLSRVGQPFFTTKAPGSGMGLGIFLTRAIIEKLGGSFSIESEVGQGTQVRVALPVNSGS